MAVSCKTDVKAATTLSGPITMRRRALLRGAIGGAGATIGARLAGTREMGPALAAESGPASLDVTPSGPRVLVAYFSRAGENYSYGGRTDLTVGNTEVMAGIAADLVDCDVYCIRPADPYSDDYDATVARNVREQEGDVRPVIVHPLASIEPYDVVLLGSPIWNVRPPMIMATFAESFDFTSRAIFPFTTHAMSGLGTAMRDYGVWSSDATIGEGLAVRGEEVRQAGPAVASWLRRIDLLGGHHPTPWES